MYYSIQARKTSRHLLVFWSLMISLHFVHLAVFYAYDVYLKRFDLNKERNLPTYAQGIQMLLVAGLLYLISQEARKNDRKNGKYWFSLSWIFVFLTLDEVFQIHDRLNDILKPLASLSQHLHFPWVVVYVPLLLVVGAFYIKFLAGLPRRWAWHIIMAGGVYVTGAVVMEIIGASYTARYGRRHLGYAFFTSVEEILEIAGMAYFAIVLICYIQVVCRGLSRQYGSLRLDIPPVKD